LFSNKNISLYKFLKFAIVGGIGAIITWGLTYILTEYAHFWYMWSLVISTFIAMVSNYLLNSLWTFKAESNANDADYEWNSYYRGNLIQRWWKKSLLNQVASLVPNKNLNYIDFGCGSSPLATIIKSDRYTGVDGNFNKIKFMNEKKLPYRYICDNVCSDGSKQNLGIYKGFDVALAVEVIEHMRDLPQASKFVKLLSSSVNENGYVVIATPDYSSPRWRIIEKIYGWLMPSAYANDHKVRFSERSLIGLCRGYGLEWMGTKRVAGCDMVCKFVKSQTHES
jgi:2-polyprenyl-3-methyl-5-hydroxy-6-metoxy-1,4-benzoquinol methylase